MREIHGDLWAFYGRAVIAVTTHGHVTARGECPMPRGCARQARERFPALPRLLGALVSARGNHVFEVVEGIVNFPVEHHWLENPDLRLIERSAAELVALADARGWLEVIVPRPGCGGGGLEWAVVRSILERHFDDRFRVIAPEEVS